MITLLLLLTMMVSIMIVSVVLIGTGGAVFAILFGDLIVCIFIISMIVKLIRKK